MAVDTVTPRSRRVLLAAAAGSLAALAAQALGRPLPTRAANGDPLTVGSNLSGTATTKITNNTNGNTVFWGASDSGVGVYGTSRVAAGVRGESSAWKGVYGLSGSNAGVLGESGSGAGVQGFSSSGFGVFGESASSVGVFGGGLAASQAATVGQSYRNATGLLGLSGGVSDPLPAAPAKTGVYGYAAQDANARGVYGETTTGVGVYGVSASSFGVGGESGSGVGVFGTSTSGIGVGGASTSATGVQGTSSATNRPATAGFSSGGSTGVQGYSGAGSPPAAPTKTGVYGYAAQDANARGVTGRTTEGRGVNGTATTGRGVHGYASTGVGVYATCGAGGAAFQAEGPVHFSSAGLTTIAAGSPNVSVTPGIDLTDFSQVLCTLQGNPGPGITLSRAVVHPSANTFTIYLTGKAAADTRVAWFVIGGRAAGSTTT